MATVNLEHISPLLEELNNHQVYGDLRSMQDLRVFMNHHVFSVWDFMSLVKYLQNRIAPAQVPWMPRGTPSLRYFINQLVLEEESDQLPGNGDRPLYGSHYELYIQAMAEVGADHELPGRFLQLVRDQGIDAALESDLVPEPARLFSETTFCMIKEDRPHLVAASLALGRETVIPDMFRRLLASMDVGRDRAPKFHDYLERHVHMDEDFHGPMSRQMLDELCGDDPQRKEEAEAAAEEAICARIRFWDGVHEAIVKARG